MVQDVHGNKVKLFGIMLAIVSGAFFVLVAVTPLLLRSSEKVLSESLDMLKEAEVLLQETGKYQLDYNKTNIVECKDGIAESQTTILGIKADIERYKGYIERNKQDIERRKIKLKESQDELKDYAVELEKAKAEVESTDPESKIYEIVVSGYKDRQEYYNSLKKRCAYHERRLLESKEDIEGYEKTILRYEGTIKIVRGTISAYEASLASSEASLEKRSSDDQQEAAFSTDELEKVLGSLDQHRQAIFTPTYIGVLLFHSMSMLLFFIIAKSWIAKDPFSKSVVISFRLLGILWIGHAVFTFGYVMMLTLRSAKLELMNQIPDNLSTLPEFGNVDSLIAGLLFLCLSYIMEHGSQMREDNSLTV